MNTLSQTIEMPCPIVRNWGYLENWKSTASNGISL